MRVDQSREDDFAACERRAIQPFGTWHRGRNQTETREIGDVREQIVVCRRNETESEIHFACPPIHVTCHPPETIERDRES